MKECVVLTAVLFVAHVWGRSGIEHLIENRWIRSATASPTNLAVKLQLGAFDIGQGNLWRSASEFMANDEELILTPDQETRFSTRHSDVRWTPVSFKSQQKGFRIIATSHWWPNPPVTDAIVYLALSDTLVEMGEDDVEMVMENGEWITAEDARRRLEIEKLGWPANILIPNEEGILRDPKLMAEVLGDPVFSNKWYELIEKGYIKTNVVEKEGSPSQKKKGRAAASPPSGEENDEEQLGKPNNLWLYGGILLCILLPVPILYFIRRKFSNH